MQSTPLATALTKYKQLRDHLQHLLATLLRRLHRLRTLSIPASTRASEWGDWTRWRPLAIETVPLRHAKRCDVTGS
jgi:hypothetical protein